MGQNISVLESIRELHCPAESYNSLECQGCDSEGFESEYPQWPCRTATLVYSEEEIKETLYWFNIWRKWIIAKNYRERMAKGWRFQDDLAKAWYRQILHQLESTNQFLKNVSK